MLCLRSTPTTPPCVVCTVWQPQSTETASAAKQVSNLIAQFLRPANPESSPPARIMPPFARGSLRDEPRSPQRVFPAVHGVRVRGPDLRIDLEPLPQALSRPRGARADSGAGAVHGRNGDRLLALQPLVPRLEE